jgi:hypothetical protein
LQRIRAAKDDRIRQVSETLVRHLHAFVREIGPTQAEWEAGIDFLTRTGQMCDDKRQEFILLSDTLGVSTRVAVSYRRFWFWSIKPAAIRKRAVPESAPSRMFSIDAFSSREPIPTSLENAMAHHAATNAAARSSTSAIASRSTSTPAPGLTPFSARWRRKARAPGTP